MRTGDNLYAVSIVAVDAATGKYRRHFQQVHHDIWDYDASNPVILMDVNVGGRLLAYSAGNALIGSARGDSVWLFGLDGTLPPVQPGAAVSRQTAVPADSRRNRILRRRGSGRRGGPIVRLRRRGFAPCF